MTHVLILVAYLAGVYCVLDGNIFVKCRQNSVIFDAETCCRSRVQSQFYLGLHLIPMEAFNVSILTTSMYPFASNTKEDRASQATMELFCSDTRLDLVVDETVNPPVRWELSRRIFLVCERGYKPQLTYNVALIRPRIDYKGDLQTTTTKGACVKDDALYDEHGIPRKRVRWDMPSGKETEEAANVAKMASIDLTSSSRSKVMLSFDLNLPASEE